MSKIANKNKSIKKIKLNSALKSKLKAKVKGKTKKIVPVKKQQKKTPKQSFVSITEAAEINDVTRQAIYVAIKLNKLKARKENTRWEIDLRDLEAYRDQKYSRSRSTYKGELLFDNSRGYFSVNQAAEILNVPAQKIYYATRSNHLKAHRKGSAWVIHVNDINQYKKDVLQKKPSRQEAS